MNEGDNVAPPQPLLSPPISSQTLPNCLICHLYCASTVSAFAVISLIPDNKLPEAEVASASSQEHSMHLMLDLPPNVTETWSILIE